LWERIERSLQHVTERLIKPNKIEGKEPSDSTKFWPADFLWSCDFDERSGWGKKSED
jgi:hypothetical protein